MTAKPTKRTPYLRNKDLLAEVIASKERGYMSDNLANMLMLLTSRYAKRGNFVNYSYNEDMVAYALMMLVNTWDRFNPEKSNNPFAFYTQCIKNSFIQFLNRERRQRDIRDALLVEGGMNPSFTYSQGNSVSQTVVEDEEDHNANMKEADDLKRQFLSDDPDEPNET